MRNAVLGMTFLVSLMFAAAAIAQPTLPGGGGGGGGSSSGGSGGGGSGGGGGSSQVWGAVAFTSDGSYARAWRHPSKESAEASVAKDCAAFGRGACRTIGFPGEVCVALVHYRGGRWRITFAGAGNTYPDAQRNAMENCEKDDRVGRRRNRCRPLTAICGDGR